MTCISLLHSDSFPESLSLKKKKQKTVLKPTNKVMDVYLSHIFHNATLKVHIAGLK